jgi:Repeat of unknown function (DUF5907)
MKKLFLLMLFALAAHGQSPLVRNFYTTNANIGAPIWTNDTSVHIIGQIGLQINNSDDLIKIKAVGYNWPTDNGPSGTTGIFRNDGSGTLDWSTNFNSLKITNLYLGSGLTLSYATATTLPIINSSKQLVSLAAGTNGQVLTLSSGAPVWADAPGSSSSSPINNLYVTNLYATNVTVQTSITLKGKQLGATHLNGTNVYPVINFTNNSDINYAWDGVSNVTETIANNAVTDAKFRQGVARSVVGVTGNATANTADIQGTADGVLRVNSAGTALAFGPIDLSKTNAATGVLQAASFPALTGDVTTSAGALAATIANSAVTYAKMQNVSAASRLLGRGSAGGSGAVQEIDLGTGLTMSGTTLSASSTAGATPGFTITGNYLITANNTNIDNGTAGTNAFIIVGGSGSSVTNGANLLAAYAAAKLIKPAGAALSTVNRETILLLPGVYDLGSSTLTMDSSFIDVVGISSATGTRSGYTSSGPANLGDTIVKSTGSAITLSASGLDCGIRNLCVQGGNPALAATSGWGANWFCINVVIYSPSSFVGMTTSQNCNGYWEDVLCPYSGSFGYGAIASGTFVRCIGSDGSFGGNTTGTFSGLGIDCMADNLSFGRGGISGTLIRCRYVNVSGTDAANFASSGNISGTLIGCIGPAGKANFGNGTMSGTMYNCSGGTFGSTIVSGTVKGCDFAGWNGAYTMNTADSTQVSSNSTEQNFSVTKTIGVNNWKAGKAWRWEAWGKYSCTNATPGTITFKTKFGSTAANTSDAMALPAGGASNIGWKASGMFTCRTVGASGTISSQSLYEMDSTTLDVLNESLKPSNGTTTIDTTASQTFQISVTFSVASASNAATLENFLLIPMDVN